MWKELKTGFLMMVALTVLTGVVYPAVVTVVAQVFFKDQANGSLVSAGGQTVGSRLIGQNFAKPEYFHPRPSNAGSGYDGSASGGSNLGPTSAKLLNGSTKVDDKTRAEVVEFDGIKDRIARYCIDNEIPFDSSEPLDAFKNAKGELDDVRLIKAFNDDGNPLVIMPKTPLPSDAVTGSASGLDPDISPANADLQATRVARARGASIEKVKAIVMQHTTARTLGILGEPHVNVLELNLALDAEFGRR